MARRQEQPRQEEPHFELTEKALAYLARVTPPKQQKEMRHG
ncbi:MAG TPA: hypothetical protein VGD10_08235 [Allosphingosinicella sp.]